MDVAPREYTPIAQRFKAWLMVILDVLSNKHMDLSLYMGKSMFDHNYNDTGQKDPIPKRVCWKHRVWTFIGCIPHVETRAPLGFRAILVTQRTLQLPPWSTQRV